MGNGALARNYIEYFNQQYLKMAMYVETAFSIVISMPFVIFRNLLSISFTIDGDPLFSVKKRTKRAFIRCPCNGWSWK
jgi:hypothetical protein